MVYDIRLQRKRDYKIRVCGKNSIPLTLFFCLFQFDCKQLHLFIIYYQEIYIRYPLNLHLSNTEKDIYCKTCRNMEFPFVFVAWICK